MSTSGNGMETSALAATTNEHEPSLICTVCSVLPVEAYNMKDIITNHGNQCELMSKFEDHGLHIMDVHIILVYNMKRASYMDTLCSPCAIGLISSKLGLITTHGRNECCSGNVRAP